jgi:hypothetical protein
MNVLLRNATVHCLSASMGVGMLLYQTEVLRRALQRGMRYQWQKQCYSQTPLAPSETIRISARLALPETLDMSVWRFADSRCAACRPCWPQPTPN